MKTEKTSLYEKLFELKKEGIKLERDTSWYNYKYATLDQIQDKLSPVLENLKLLIMHKIENDELITIIMDIESWDSESSSIRLTTEKAQDRGSEITYYRRYNLLALLDLKTEDDDWKKATTGTTKSKEDKSFDKRNFTPTMFRSLVDDLKIGKRTKSLEETLEYIRSKYILSLEIETDIRQYFDAHSKWHLDKPLDTNTTK